MSFLTILQLIVNIILVGLLLFLIIATVAFLIFDKGQKQHSVLRNYPVLARVRYFLEHIGPELRQYLFLNDNEDKPFSRLDYQDIVLAGKYKNRGASFGTQKNYQHGFFIINAMFPTQKPALKVDNTHQITTFLYQIKNEGLVNRKEKAVEKMSILFYFHLNSTLKLVKILSTPILQSVLSVNRV